MKISAAEIADAMSVSNIMDVATEQFGVVIGTSLTFEVKCNGIAATGSAELLPRPAVVTNTQVELELSFANGNTATARSTVISA